MKNLVSRFVKDESGATAIEYGLIAAGISVAIIAVVQGLGSKLKSSLDAYNQAVGSLEGNVLVKARKFRDLQSVAGEEIKALDPIDRVPRMLQAPELTEGLPFAEQEVEQV